MGHIHSHILQVTSLIVKAARRSINETDDVGLQRRWAPKSEGKHSNLQLREKSIWLVCNNRDASISSDNEFQFESPMRNRQFKKCNKHQEVYYDKLCDTTADEGKKIE